MRQTSLQKIVLALGLACALGRSGAAQTTGCANFNAYTINGQNPGSTSCQNLVFPSSSSLTFSVSTSSTATFVSLVFTFCPCTPAAITFPPCGTKIQTVDLDLTCPLVAVSGIPVAGVFTFTVPPFGCPGVTVLSTQAVVIDPACSNGFILTQAYRFACI
jgi:hypothetical protein